MHYLHSYKSVIHHYFFCQKIRSNCGFVLIAKFFVNIRRQLGKIICKLFSRILIHERRFPHTASRKKYNRQTYPLSPRMITFKRTFFLVDIVVFKMNNDAEKLWARQEEAASLFFQGTPRALSLGKKPGSYWMASLQIDAPIAHQYSKNLPTGK